MRINPYKSKAKYIAVSGILLGLAVVLTSIESLLSAFLPVGVRIGLANIVVLTAAAVINLPTAFVITILKSCFVLLTRGFTAGVMSLSGGVLAFAVTALLLSKTKSSYVFISVISAVFHIAGQMLSAVIITQSVYTFYYFPLLIATAVASGFITGVVSGIIIPKAEKIISI